MMRCLLVGAVFVVGLSFVLNVTVEGGKDKPPTIKQIMLKAHTAPKGEDFLLKRIIAGDGTKEDKAQLIELYMALQKCTPPTGDRAKWNDRTKALVEAAKGDDVDALKRATNCAACHNDHKKK